MSKKETKIIEITARFTWERYVFQDGTPQRCIIGNADQILDDECQTEVTITIKGECQDGDLKSGVIYRFDGEWKNHPKYGQQFCFHSFCQPTPVTRDAIESYLSTCYGIGEMRATKIYDMFGHDCIKQIKNNPSILKQIKGITPEIAEGVQKSLLERESQEQLIIELKSLLSGFGIPKRVFNLLQVDFGTAAAEKIRENPYLLTEYKGVGFLKADEIYLSLSKPKNSILRQKYAMKYIVSNDTTGSVWLEQKKVLSDLSKLIDQNTEGKSSPLEALTEAINGELLTQTCENNTFYIGLPQYDYAEQFVAEWLSKRVEQESRFPKELHYNNENIPSEHQLEQYKNATKSSVGLLTGSPGTGKTWIVGRVIETLRKNGEPVFVCAPTGKAALRVVESLKLQGVNVIATTIHSLLYAQVVNGTWQFQFNETNRLQCKYLIVDESSMIDILLLKSLLQATPNDCNVLFVGDPDQLSPVGRGAPLRDMIAAEIPCGKLTEIRRNSGEIVQACANIRDNKKVEYIGKTLESPENLIILKTPQELKDVMKTIEQIHKKEGESVLNTQIIVAINEKSPLSRNKLNDSLQDYFNPLPTGNAEQYLSKVKKFRMGDKIICLSNGIADTTRTGVQVRVANGDIGTIENIVKEGLIVSLNNDMIIVPSFNDTWGESDWDLGYAISGHKSQGSEWPVVIVILDSSFSAGMICDRHWIYTTISRAKKRCYLLGNQLSIEAMSKISKMWNRKTLLKERFLMQKWSFLDAEFNKLLK
jgi:exodeoxyribonuclease V alpha subunit